MDLNALQGIQALQGLQNLQRLLLGQALGTQQLELPTASPQMMVGPLAVTADLSKPPQPTRAKWIVHKGRNAYSGNGGTNMDGDNEEEWDAVSASRPPFDVEDVKLMCEQDPVWEGFTYDPRKQQFWKLKEIEPDAFTRTRGDDFKVYVKGDQSTHWICHKNCNAHSGSGGRNMEGRSSEEWDRVSLERMPMSIEDVQNICDQDPECTGFTYDGTEQKFWKLKDMMPSKFRVCSGYEYDVYIKEHASIAASNWEKEQAAVAAASLAGMPVGGCKGGPCWGGGCDGWLGGMPGMMGGGMMGGGCQKGKGCMGMGCKGGKGKGCKGKGAKGMGCKGAKGGMMMGGMDGWWGMPMDGWMGGMGGWSMDGWSAGNWPMAGGNPFSGPPAMGGPSMQQQLQRQQQQQLAATSVDAELPVEEPEATLAPAVDTGPKLSPSAPVMQIPGMPMPAGMPQMDGPNSGPPFFKGCGGKGGGKCKGKEGKEKGKEKVVKGEGKGYDKGPTKARKGPVSKNCFVTLTCSSGTATGNENELLSACAAFAIAEGLSPPDNACLTTGNSNLCNIEFPYPEAASDFIKITNGTIQIDGKTFRVRLQRSMLEAVAAGGPRRQHPDHEQALNGVNAEMWSNYLAMYDGQPPPSAKRVKVE